jgi:hypothetical protein
MTKENIITGPVISLRAPPGVFPHATLWRMDKFLEMAECDSTEPFGLELMAERLAEV